jgi:hypothetical protein
MLSLRLIYVLFCLQIQVRTYQCGATVSCNCAVVVREDNNVLGLNGCGNNGVVPISYLASSTSGASITVNPDGITYTVSYAALSIICKLVKLNIESELS